MENYLTRRIKKKPNAAHSIMGINTANNGLNPYNRLAGSMSRCIMVNTIPIPKATNTLKPIVASRNGPNTKETASMTRTNVANGCNNFFQNARK